MNIIKYLSLCTPLLLAHITFMIVTIDYKLLAPLPTLYALVIHRLLIIVQFVAIGVTILLANHWNIRSKALLFLAMVVGVNTIYTITDFQSGFYGALLDSGSGIVPRMRTSAHMMAYSDLGKIVPLDPHGEYFLEFTIVYFLSNVLNANYILVYAYVIKPTVIILWSILFLMLYEKVLKDKGTGLSAILGLMIMSTTLMASVSNYNIEQASFGTPLALLTLLLLMKRPERSRGIRICTMLTALGLILASFSETVVLALIFFVAILTLSSARLTTKKITVDIGAFTLFLVLTWARIFQFTSLVYVKRYWHFLMNFVYSFFKALMEGIQIGPEKIAPSVHRMPNIVDKVYSVVVVGSYILVLALLALLSAYALYKMARERTLNSLSISITSVYLLLFFMILASYVLGKVGFNVSTDVSSHRILIFPILPLIPVIAARYISKIKSLEECPHGNRKRAVLAKLAYASVIILLLLAPQYTHAITAKSSYDMMHEKGDINERVILANSLFNFTMKHYMWKYRIFSAGDPTIDFFYSMPIEYKLNTPFYHHYLSEAEAGIVFNNGGYMIFLTDIPESMIVLKSAW